MANISIVIPTHNRYDYLKMAVDSALSQTLPPHEIIIVDDCSDPNVKKKINERWADNPLIRLHFLSEKSGVSLARNIGKELSSGDFLLFLDDDDMLLPDMLEKSLEEMGDVDVVGCRTRMISDDAGLSKRKIKSYRWGYSKNAEIYALDQGPINHVLLHAPSIHSFLGKAALMESVDFDEALHYGEDLDYWIRLALEGARFRKAEFEGAIYRMHRKNASGKALYQQKEGYYRKQMTNKSLTQEARGIAEFKFGLMSIFQSRLKGIPMLLSAMSKPVGFIRHTAFFIRLVLAGATR